MPHFLLVFGPSVILVLMSFLIKAKFPHQNYQIQEQKMAKRLKKAAAAAKTASGAMGTINQIGEKVAAMASSLSEQPTAKQVMESAQQICLAGLGAFSKAQNEGRKVFEGLVSQGEKLEKQTRHVAESTLETAKEQASKTIGMASGKFDKLEQVFENRVHKSLNRLGVLTSKDVEALSGQVAQLSEAVRALMAQEKRTPVMKAAAKPASKPFAKQTVKKPTAAKRLVAAKKTVNATVRPLVKKAISTTKAAAKKVVGKTK
jgi:poly(hydroxyalkanoate) granule-associated protein